jgi:hypothetical protein
MRPCGCAIVGTTFLFHTLPMRDEAHGLDRITSLNNLHHETDNHLPINARSDAFAVRDIAGLLGNGPGKWRRSQRQRIYYQDKH